MTDNKIPYSLPDHHDHALADSEGFGGKVDRHAPEHQPKEEQPNPALKDVTLPKRPRQINE